MSRRRFAAALVGLQLSILLAACGGAPSSGGGSNTQPMSKQMLYATSLNRDYKSLDRGVLTYTRLRPLKTGAAVTFQVTVTDAGRGGGERIRLTNFNGMDVYQADVPTGGDVAVKIVTCENLTCHSESSARAPVTFKGQQRDWFWQITAGNPGRGQITLRVDTYDRHSRESLREEVVAVPVSVIATSTFVQHRRHQQFVHAANSTVGFIQTLGAIAGSVVAVGGIVGWIAVRVRKRAAVRQQAGRPADDETAGGGKGV